MATTGENKPLLPVIQEEPIGDGNNSKSRIIVSRDGIHPTNVDLQSSMSNKENEEECVSLIDRSKNDGYSNIDTNNENKSYSQYGSRSRQAVLFLIMLFVNVLGPLSTEAQVPALQDIANDLHCSSTWVQMTITIYMLSFGASQLFFGTLSDMYGRRNTLLAGLVIYTLTNVGCALSPNVILLNIFRAIQAMGSGAGMVIVYAIARDVFQQNDRTRVLGILGGLRPIVIAASPVFGGAVTAFLGWRYIFWIIGGLSLILLVITFFVLPETRDSNTVHITTRQEYVDTVKMLVKNRIFVGLVLISGAVYAGVFIMFNEFSFVMENRYGFSEFDTGLLCGLIVFGLMVGSLISIMLVRCFNPISVVCIGIIEIFLCGGLLILPLILYSKTAPTFVGLTEYWTLIPLFLYVSADGLMLPHLISTALEPFRRQAGTASALAGFWRFFSAAVIALIVSASSSEHLSVLHIGTACMAFVAAILYIFTLYGADASEFTKSRDAEILQETENHILSIKSTNPGGVRVIGDEDETIEESNEDDDGNVNDETPLMQKSKHVTIQA